MVGASAVDGDYLPTLKPVNSLTKWETVVLGCKLVGVTGGRDKVVALSAVDFLTREVLKHSLVEPPAPVIEWRIDITGMAPGTMSAAEAQNATLRSWYAARAKLCEHVGEDTIMVGFALNYALRALRVVHTRVVHLAVVTAEAALCGKKRNLLQNGRSICCAKT
ncbi:Small RNA degrading nuclease 2 [Madurella mycetomatis]|uniref:Small RNA degrading nuclease 2 n=1 Tax=Madurella mycetomatis TaxID=100816 RepID=A0A175WH04_9PEZI|nr:Small RNA degrading nuclease 2 [Madurella mycetomatis]